MSLVIRCMPIMPAAPSHFYYLYPSIVAETASNFNQAMTRAHLLKTNPSKSFPDCLARGGDGNFHRYFFIMPTLARFELETHQRIEKGQALTADSMIKLMADLFSEGFGGEMDLDRERVGITWGTFTTHLYIDFYSFQYAIGISAANAIASEFSMVSQMPRRITSIFSKPVHPSRPWKYSKLPAWI